MKLIITFLLCVFAVTVSGLEHRLKERAVVREPTAGMGSMMARKTAMNKKVEELTQRDTERDAAEKKQSELVQTLEKRLEQAEARELKPGPPGRDGRDGRDGEKGEPG